MNVTVIYNKIEAGYYITKVLNSIAHITNIDETKDIPEQLKNLGIEKEQIISVFEGHLKEIYPK